ncbi:Glycine-rich RNA-binding protein RZ1B [Vitis vinifera]|uniref:Glycine-rich RNA-binding protein RZ1B n=1 Tax=Vitis vinifera TaxID=29760 RepID=A0A438FRH7_VITVI|nr:Glycine-rich RNA-binding protein RZ1B [Vitis vinifera]
MGEEIDLQAKMTASSVVALGIGQGTALHQVVAEVEVVLRFLHVLGFSGGRGDRFGGERDRYMEDRYDGGRYGDRDRFESRDNKYGTRDRYVNDRYAPSGDRFSGDRYGGSDRYPQNGYGKDRGYDRDAAPKRGGDRYAGGGSARNEGRSYRNRPGPYDRPNRGGRPSSFDRY